MIWILSNWKLACIGLVTTLLAVQSMRLTLTQKDVALLEAKIEQAEIVAEAYTQESEKNLDTLRTKIPGMVESAQKNAVANYKKRFGSAACGTRADGLLPTGSTTAIDAADSTQGADDPSGEFISACARDATRLNLWIEWATLNHLPVK